MRLAAIRTLGVFLALYAIGAAIQSCLLLARGIDPDSTPAWGAAMLIAFLLAWIATMILRRPHVFQRLTLVVVIALLILPAASQTWDGNANALALSPRERQAFEYLRNAESVEMPRVGFSVVYSGGYLAMRILRRSLAADAAFKELVRTGTIAGQLYGLCGVRETDPLFYRMHAPHYANMTGEVVVFGGCVMAGEPIATFVRHPGAMRLRPRETLQEWWRAHEHNGGELHWDIEGGAYSRMYFDRDADEPEALAAERACDFTR